MIDALVGGLATGSLYAMLAVGFVLIYASTGVANFAQGALSMIAAFMGYTAFTHLGFPAWAAALLGVLAAVMVAYLLYALGLRPLAASDHLFKGVATLAINIILVNIARIIWGPSTFQFDELFPHRTFQLGGLALPLSYLATFLVALISALGLQMFLRYTRTGTAIRSVTQNPEAAMLMGVNLTSISALSWAIAGIVAGLAGILLAPITYVSFGMTDPYLVRMFAAAALGGLNSVGGAVAGGLILGALEGVVGRVLPPTLIDVVSVLVLLVVLIFRPQGLFGIARVRRI